MKKRNKDPFGCDKGRFQHFFLILVLTIFYISVKSTEPPHKNAAQTDHKKEKEKLKAR